VLKIFAGAEPLPIMQQRREWHRAKLDELEGYLRNVGENEQFEGVRASLMVGTNYHRLLLEAIERFLEAQAAIGNS
jgi:hypothetical protein